MRTMALEEARQSFDRLIEIVKKDSVVLRDGDQDVVVFVPMHEFEPYRRWFAIKARGGLTANGLTDEIVAEILKD